MKTCLSKGIYLLEPKEIDKYCACLIARIYSELNVYRSRPCILHPNSSLYCAPQSAWSVAIFIPAVLTNQRPIIFMFGI